MAMHGSCWHSLRTVANDVEKVLLDMGSFSIGAWCFGDARPAERQLAVETWFGMESDTEAIIDTADSEFLEESSNEETQDEDEDEIKVLGLMHMAAPNRQMRSGCANRAYLEFHGHPWNQLRERVVVVHRKRLQKSLPVLETVGSAFLLRHRGKTNNARKRWSSFHDTETRQTDRQRGGQSSDSGLIAKRIAQSTPSLIQGCEQPHLRVPTC